MSEQNVYAVGTSGGGGVFVMKLAPGGKSLFVPADQDELQRALLLGVTCMNTGVADDAVMAHVAKLRRTN